MGVEVLDIDIAPEQMNVFEINNTYLSEIDRKGESSSKHSDDSSHLIDRKTNLNSKHGLEEPAKSGSVDNSHDINGDKEEIAEVEAARHPINLVDNSQELDIGTKEIKELEATNHQISFVDNSQELNAGRKETNEADYANISKDAVDVCPAPKQMHRFCFVKFRPYEDPKLKAKIEQADKDLRKKNETRFQIIEALKAKKSEHANVISQLKPLTGDNKRYRTIIDEKREEMEPLTTALGKLRDMNSSGKGIGLCSSDEELDDLLVGIDMDEVRMEEKIVVSKMEHLEKELKIIDDGISYLLEELGTITEKRDTSFRILTELRKERDEANGCFYKNRSLLSNAMILAAKKNKAALEELCCNEVEIFMAQWNNNKAFRDDYKRRILPSLDIRQLSRDGRRNLDEKPIREACLANEVEKTSLKMTTAESNEKLVLPPQDNIVDKPKIQQEVKSSTGVESRHSDHLEDTEKNYEIESKELPKGNDVDLEKLKEMRREEEIAKSKLAMEQKKLAEKAAAKAAARAEKEAEKKMKEKEKKAKMKAEISESATSGEQPETIKEKTSEPDEAKVNADVYNSTIKKEPKAKVNFKARAKASNQVPKVLLKKKKLQMYWTWAAPAAFFAVVFGMGPTSSHFN